METVTTITFAILMLALVITFIRLLIGPTLPDRVVALELIPSILVSMIGAYAIFHESSSFIDVSIVVALVSFLAAIGFARFLERGGPRND